MLYIILNKINMNWTKLYSISSFHVPIIKNKIIIENKYLTIAKHMKSFLYKRDAKKVQRIGFWLY